MNKENFETILEEDMHTELDDFIYDNDLKKEYVKNHPTDFISFMFNYLDKKLLEKYENEFCEGDDFNKWAKQEFKDTPTFDEAHPPRPL